MNVLITILSVGIIKCFIFQGHMTYTVKEVAKFVPHKQSYLLRITKFKA